MLSINFFFMLFLLKKSQIKYMNIPPLPLWDNGTHFLISLTPTAATTKFYLFESSWWHIFHILLWSKISAHVSSHLLRGYSLVQQVKFNLFSLQMDECGLALLFQSHLHPLPLTESCLSILKKKSGKRNLSFSFLACLKAQHVNVAHEKAKTSLQTDVFWVNHWFLTLGDNTAMSASIYQHEREVVYHPQGLTV